MAERLRGRQAVAQRLRRLRAEPLCRDCASAGLALEAAIDAAITRWMGWKIDRATAREHGIPKGLPYLTGFVTHFEIQAEQAD